MKVEDPSALRFILQDELYLLEEDKPNYITDSNRIAAPEPQIETPQITFNYLGSNKKNLLVLVHYPAHGFIAEDHLTAHILATIAAFKGDKRARWLSAATLDGYLRSTGKRQIFGTA